jgi:hypothetical protein
MGTPLLPAGCPRSCAVSAWKDLERRVARALGGQRAGPRGRYGSDVVGVPFAVECKRTVSDTGGIRGAWVHQARAQGAREGQPWVLVVSRHNDRRPVAVCDFELFVELAREAGRIVGDSTC